MELWSLGALLVLFLVAVAGGIVGGSIKTWLLHRRIYSLECAQTDLENKILVEVKRRAGQERQKGAKLEDEILAAAEKKLPAGKPWWFNQAEGHN
jgi:hypothetical protein